MSQLCPVSALRRGLSTFCNEEGLLNIIYSRAIDLYFIDQPNLLWTLGIASAVSL